MGKYYFALKDGTYNPETGEYSEAGIMVKINIDDLTPEEAQAFVEDKLPYKGRLRMISEEEYMRDYGDDEDEGD